MLRVAHLALLLRVLGAGPRRRGAVVGALLRHLLVRGAENSARLVFHVVGLVVAAAALRVGSNVLAILYDAFERGFIRMDWCYSCRFGA